MAKAARAKLKDFMTITDERLLRLWTSVAEESHVCMLREGAVEAVYNTLEAGDERRTLLAVLKVNHRLSFAYKLLVDCGAAIDSMLLSDSLVHRSAWSNAKLTHGRTTAFAWTSFLNATYQFRELLKAAFNQVEMVGRPLRNRVASLDTTILKTALAKTDKCIGHLVKWRGANTHNYIRQHKFVVGLEAMELLSAQGRKYEHRRRYVNAAKSLMRSEMQRAIVGCVEALEAFYADLTPTTTLLSSEISSLVDGVGITWGDAGDRRAA